MGTPYYRARTVEIVEYSKRWVKYVTVPTNKRPGRPRSDNGQRTNKADSRPALISKIHHLLEIHSGQRVRNDVYNSRCSHKLHKAFYKAIRLCYEQKIYESKLFPVAQLFLELYHCEGNLKAIFSILACHVTHTPAVMHNDVNILYPSHKSDSADAFEYYLYHISTLVNEEYGANSGSPLDLINLPIEQDSSSNPLLAAVAKKDPRYVLSLLRYGADPFKTIGEGEHIVPDAVEQLLNELSGIFLFKNTAFSSVTREALAAEEEKVISCLSMVRRAVLDIPISVSSHVRTFSEEGEEPVEEVKEYRLHPSLANSLDLASFRCTSSLQQLCRCVIRGHLTRVQGTRRNTPVSISHLPLPRPLRQYVDLQF